MEEKIVMKEIEAHYSTSMLELPEDLSILSVS
jgi:hypothetical protein